MAPSRKAIFCRDCGRKFYDGLELRRHVREKHQFEERQEDRGREEPDKRKHRCERCKYKTTRSSNLRRHMMLVHEKNFCSRDPLGLDVTSTGTSQGLHPISPVAISVTTSNGFQTPPAPQRPSGKPLAMLMQSMEDTDEEEEKPTSPAQPTETPLTQPLPEPVLSLSSAFSSRPEPASSPSALSTQLVPSSVSSESSSGSILVTVVEKRVQRFYSRGKLIRQKDSTETFLQLVPAAWDQQQDCHHQLQK
ncbi:uncharacterized protein LOC121419982 [Lytechinus variegatus]|uniref:uncharacterized protein LOC121419982 n=1 Tax=Lytechinus variegatus TaxID=7654 RepID=UPI001BB1B9D3|nr:uncharacterized protein LOC121419982 [Lytechinus variegatus]